MDKFLDAANSYLIGAALAFAFFAIASIFVRSRTNEWTIMGLSLRPVAWLATFAVAFVVLFLVSHVVQAVANIHNIGQVSRASTNKFTFIVTDFQGEGGVEAADFVADQLRSFLGDGVQVLRVPLKISTHSYGDVAGKRVPSVASAYMCARDYDGDVVVWGHYHRESQILQLSSTVRADDCLPSCGLAGKNDPISFIFSDLTKSNSDASTRLTSYMVSAVSVPITVAVSPTGQLTCLTNESVVEDHELKIREFLDHAPSTFPGRRHD